MKIQVTKEDIRLGHRFKPQECPVALATLRAIPGARVNACGLYVCINGREYKPVVELISLKQFVLLFDRGRFVEPFEFEIDYKAKQ